MKSQTYACLLALASCWPATAFAAPAEPSLPSETVHFDAEIDPTAFILKGYSLHLGVGYQHIRADLGAFALDVPEFFHGNKGFAERFDGASLDLHYFLLPEPSGGFIGVGVSYSTKLVQLTGTDLARTMRGFAPGAEIGWRFQFPFGLYIKPWIGLSYDFSAEDIHLANRVFKSAPWSPFAAIHIGYRIQ